MRRVGKILQFLLIPACVIVLLVWFVSGGSNAAKKLPVPNGRLAAKPGSTLFGVAGGLGEVSTYEGVFGSPPPLLMQFVSWNRGLQPISALRAVHAAGVPEYMLTWEPWAPTPPRLGTAAQGYAQRAYDNRAIASGRWDSYIRSWARAIASSGFSSVYVRFGQEQNGGYYPWSNDPREYVAAWRRIYKIFHEEGASNAVFLYSAAPQPSESNTSWARGFWRYWPGRAYVGAVGLTAINYGVGGVCVAVPCAAGATDYAPAIFLQRLRLEQELSGKHVVIPELNTARSGATAWLRELASQLRTARVARDLSAVVLSQQPSRASAQTVTGDLNWNALTDPGLRSSLQSFVAQIQRRARKRVVSDRSDKEARSDRL